MRAQLKRYAGADVAAQAGNQPTRTNRSQLTRFTYVTQTATRRPRILEVLRPLEYPNSIVRGQRAPLHATHIIPPVSATVVRISSVPSTGHLTARWWLIPSRHAIPRWPSFPSTRAQSSRNEIWRVEEAEGRLPLSRAPPQSPVPSVLQHGGGSSQVDTRFREGLLFPRPARSRLATKSGGSRKPNAGSRCHAHLLSPQHRALYSKVVARPKSTRDSGRARRQSPVVTRISLVTSTEHYIARWWLVPS